MMNTQIKSIFVVLAILLTTGVHAVTLDIGKFKSKATVELIKAVGEKQIQGVGAVYFRDGAGSLDLEPVFDYAAFVYVVKVKAGILPGEDLRLAYRLSLNGNEDIILIKDPGQEPNFTVAMPGSGIVTFKDGVSEQEVNNLIAKMRKAAPAGEFSYLDAIGVLTFKVEVVQAPDVLQVLQGESIVEAVDLENEVYRVPFQFDPAVAVNEKKKIDADKYRGLTKKLKADGLSFASETTIPEDLQ